MVSRIYSGSSPSRYATRNIAERGSQRTSASDLKNMGENSSGVIHLHLQSQETFIFNERSILYRLQNRQRTATAYCNSLRQNCKSLLRGFDHQLREHRKSIRSRDFTLAFVHLFKELAKCLGLVIVPIIRQVLKGNRIDGRSSLEMRVGVIVETTSIS